MTAAAFALLVTGVLLNAAAQLFLKAGTNATGVLSLTREGWAGTLAAMATQPFFVAGAACYGVSLVVWIAALTRVPVTLAYPMLSIGYIVNAAAAWFLFGESLTAQKLVGIGFIIIGVWLVARS